MHFFLQLDDEESESSDDDDDDDNTQKKSKVYVPPKVAAVPYGKFSFCYLFCYLIYMYSSYSFIRK